MYLLSKYFPFSLGGLTGCYAVHELLGVIVHTAELYDGMLLRLRSRRDGGSFGRMLHGCEALLVQGTSGRSIEVHVFHVMAEALH